jgi:hypothetical protein
MESHKDLRENNDAPFVNLISWSKIASAASNLCGDGQGNGPRTFPVRLRVKLWTCRAGVSVNPFTNKTSASPYVAIRKFMVGIYFFLGRLRGHRLRFRSAWRPGCAVFQMKALAASCEHWDSQDWRSRRAYGVRRRVNEQVGRPLTISIDRAGRVVADHAQSWSPGNSNGCEAIPSVVETRDRAKDVQTVWTVTPSARPLPVRNFACTSEGKKGSSASRTRERARLLQNAAR